MFEKQNGNLSDETYELTDEQLDYASGGMRNATLPSGGGGAGPGGFFEGANVTVWLAGVQILP